MRTTTHDAVHRLYQVSRKLYAPILAGFATRWLEEMTADPESVALCLGRDGLAPFVAAHALLQTNRHRFRSIKPRRIRLAYISRVIAQEATEKPDKARLLDRYLQGQGVKGDRPLTLVDVGIHGSIQNSLQDLFPQRPCKGHYLVLRRRADDPNGAAKTGYLADLDVAAPSPLNIGALWPPSPGWERGGTLRAGNPVFLHPRSIHILEDLWNGVGGSALSLQVSEQTGRVVVVRPSTTEVVFPPQSMLSATMTAQLKRAALKGIFDGVIHDHRGGAPPEKITQAVQEFGAWFSELDHSTTAEQSLINLLVRRSSGRNHEIWKD
jgi:hypothetical protein